MIKAIKWILTKLRIIDVSVSLISIIGLAIASILFILVIISSVGGPEFEETEEPLALVSEKSKVSGDGAEDFHSFVAHIIELMENKDSAGLLGHTKSCNPENCANLVCIGESILAGFNYCGFEPKIFLTNVFENSSPRCLGYDVNLERHIAFVYFGDVHSNMDLLDKPVLNILIIYVKNNQIHSFLMTTLQYYNLFDSHDFPCP
jgi:hypothetical protein